MDGVPCPIDGCEYQDTPRSLEAHISSKTDEAHSGEVGRSYRGRFGELSSDSDGSSSESVEEIEVEAEPVEDTEPEDGPSGGIPLPIPATYLYAVVAIVVLAALWRADVLTFPALEEDEEEDEETPDMFEEGSL